MKKEREKKYLVIGSKGHQFVDCIDWDIAKFPNLVDYDVIIANVQSITIDFLKKVSSNIIENYRKLLIRFLCSSGKLIILTDNYKFGVNKKRFPESYDNYSWSPIGIGIIKEIGNTIEVISNHFPKYFSEFKKWEYYFCVPRDCLTKELINWCGQIYDFDYKHTIQPYIVNREKRSLAGSYHLWTEAKERAKSKREIILEPIILLPLLINIDSRKAVNLLLEDILGKPQESLPHSWVENVKMPFIDDINLEILHDTNEIKTHQVKIDELNKQKRNFEYYKKLLYTDGSELEDVFKKCLIELGALVKPAKYAEEEYCLAYKENEYPVEAKGNSRSISLTDLRQLMDYLLTYDDKTGIQNKGILLGNAWKNIPIDQRNQKGKPIFPSNVIDRAESTNIALVSSVDFFVVFCKFLENKSIGKRILDCIVNSVGVVNFEKIIK